MGVFFFFSPEARAAVNRSDLRADSTTTECVADMKDRLLKAAVNRHPQILASIKNHQLKVRPLFFLYYCKSCYCAARAYRASRNFLRPMHPNPIERTIERDQFAT